MKNIILLVLTVAVLFSGCGRVSESALDRVLEKDPSFERTLSEKRRIKEKIASLQEEMQPKIEALKTKLEKVLSEYNAKKKLLGDSSHKSKNIKKLLAKKAALSLSGDEVSIWNKRAASLEKEIIARRKEIEELGSKISLLKTEIKILKE